MLFVILKDVSYGKNSNINQQKTWNISDMGGGGGTLKTTSHNFYKVQSSTEHNWVLINV